MFKKFKELKKQFSEKWKNFESQLLESNTFNLLKEKYQSLDILQQKLIKYLSVFLVLAVLAYLPLSYFFSSVSSWRSFKEKQAVSLNLLKMRKKISYSVLRYSQSELKNKIERIVEKYSTSEFQLKHKRRLLQKEGSIHQIDFDVQLDHLNIKQAVKLGTELHNLSQARLNSITMEENAKFPKHYDVTYKVSAFVSTEGGKRTAPGKRQSPRYKNKELGMEKKDSFLERTADDQLKTKSGLKRKNREQRNMNREGPRNKNKAIESIRKRRNLRDRDPSIGNVRKGISLRDKMSGSIEGGESQGYKNKSDDNPERMEMQEDEAINPERMEMQEDETVNPERMEMQEDEAINSERMEMQEDETVNPEKENTEEDIGINL